jgi:hypothetical protein
MAGSVSGLHVFAADTGPEALSLLDTNYGLLTTAFNTLQNFSNSYIDSGAVNALIVTVPAPQVFSYSDGITLLVKVAATNTSTAPTINVNGLGAKTIVNPDGSVLAAGAMAAGSWVTLTYEAGIGKFQLVDASGVTGTGKFADGTAAAPSITFGSNTTQGLYKAGTDILGLSTAGTSRGTINATGNWALPAASAGITLTVNALAATEAATLQGSTSGTATTAYQTFRDSASTRVGYIGFPGLSGGHAAFSSDNGNIRLLTPAGFAPQGTLDSGGTFLDLGWRDCPQNIQTTNYQLVLADRGKQVFMNAAGLTLTIPANSGTAFPIGATILICVGGGGALTVAITTDTLFLAGAGTTGSRTVAAFGMATLTKISATQWFIGGSGVS